MTRAVLMQVEGATTADYPPLQSMRNAEVRRMILVDGPTRPGGLPMCQWAAGEELA